MKKVFESEYATWGGWSDSSDKITVYELEEEDEFWKIYNMNHQERCELVNVEDDSIYPYSIPPGSIFYTYAFHLIGKFFVVVETAQWNV